MTSKITIEIDFDNGQPYIKVINDTQSDDVRDKLVTFFRQRLGYTSSWCRVQFFPMGTPDGPVQFHIKPITTDQLVEEARMMTLLAQKEPEPHVYKA